MISIAGFRTIFGSGLDAQRTKNTIWYTYTSVTSSCASNSTTELQEPRCQKDTPYRKEKMLPESSLFSHESESVEARVSRCAVCEGFTGWVVEKYNGPTAVLCHCNIQKLHGHIPSPSMISEDGITFYWSPTTDHLAEDGRRWHTPHFGGPPVPASHLTFEEDK